MYRVPPDRAWWPAVGAPLERGVRPHWDLVLKYTLDCGFGPYLPATDSRQTIVAKPPATTKPGKLNQTGTINPPIVTSHPVKSRIRWITATRTKSATASIVKGFNSLLLFSAASVAEISRSRQYILLFLGEVKVCLPVRPNVRVEAGPAAK